MAEFVPWPKTNQLKAVIFKLLAKLNKVLLPSLYKQGVDLAHAKKWQLALLGWRAYVTKNALDQ